MSSLETISARHRVAIIGRPNVGKSTLFNILVGQRKAVVKNQPGVTRDIQVETVEVWGSYFEIIDTGGLTEAADTFSELIREQVTELLSSVDLLLVVMDGRVGLCPEDRDIVRIAVESGCPYLLVANKIDKVAEESIATAEFYEFGEDVVAAAFEQRRGVSDILEWIHEKLPQGEDATLEGLTLSIVGKPNVGKSTLCNRLLGENRMLVSDVAGTTVDAIYSQIEMEGEKFVLVDTAGLRRKAKRTEDVEIISAFKTEEALRKSDIVLLMVDGREGPTDQDAKILEKIIASHKAVILVANKSDLGEEEMEAYRKTFREKVSSEFHFFQDIIISFISAKTGRGVKDLFEKIKECGEKLQSRIPTSKLNDFFFQVIRQAPSPVWNNRNVKFYYLTQTHQKPPSFIAFANHPDGVNPSYRRFLSKKIKKQWGLEGIPIRIFVMKGKK